jgi:hypothetical protein
MVKFNTPAGSDDIVYIFLDRTMQCQNDWTKELVKNLSDYVLSNILSKGFNVIQGIDEDVLLREAAKDYSYAVVLSTGTEFLNGDEFFHEVEKVVYSNQDFFLIGHIPDRDDGYYELHEQCYIINLNTYEDLEYPKVGQIAYYSTHIQVQPKRSDENIHDDYTPVWVTPGDTEKTYKHKWHGWNILSVAFANRKQVIPFPEQFRKNKKFYYPNYEPAFINACTYLYGKNQVATQTLFYPYNTEQIVDIKFKGPVRQLVIQASGLQFVDYLLTYGYTSETTVRFVDYNLFALECMKEIVTRWDGNDYIEFVKGYANYRAGLVGKDGKDWITLTGAEQSVNPSTWIDIIKTVKFEFRHDDLVLNKSLPVKFWVDNVPNTIVHLSHIFNYDPMATFVPLKHRLYNENLLVKKLKDHAPDAHVILVGRSCNGFTDKIEGVIDIQDLTRPTWHMNGDWDGV